MKFDQLRCLNCEEILCPKFHHHSIKNMDLLIYGHFGLSLFFMFQSIKHHIFLTKPFNLGYIHGVLDRIHTLSKYLFNCCVSYGKAIFQKGLVQSKNITKSFRFCSLTKINQSLEIRYRTLFLNSSGAGDKIPT